jgi:hypothetical protein
MLHEWLMTVSVYNAHHMSVINQRLKIFIMSVFSGKVSSPWSRLKWHELMYQTA